MDNAAPLLSICIPTYNRANFLRECLDSILISARGHEDEIEIVISDNASTDETPSLVTEFQSRYSFIRYNRNPINVIEKNFYIVSTLATSKYVWLFGDDDKMTPQAIPAVLEQLRAGYDLYVVNYSMWSRDWQTVKRHSNLPLKTDRVFDDPNELLASLGIHLGYLSAVIIRKNLLFQPSYSEYESYAAYGFGFLCAVYSGIAAHGRACYLATPLVCNRADNAPISSDLWDRNYVTGSNVVFQALLKKGYTVSAIRGARDRFLKDFVFWIILGRVRDGVNTRVMFHRLLPYYKGNLFFWTFCVPAMFMPRLALQIATDLVRQNRKNRGDHAGTIR